MNNKVATMPLYNPQVQFSLLLVLFFGLVFLYMYFLSMSVVHVVLRKEVHQSIRNIESDIALLEADYIDAQHTVSEKIATLDSFTETSEKIFVHRVPPTLVLSNSSRQ